MKTLLISRLARAFGLSRSTLLYYDRIGLLRPSGRTGAGYRCYTEKDRRRLQRLCFFREAGLTLKEIRTVLASGGKPGARLLEQRIRAIGADIQGLKNQQHLLAGMLRRVASGAPPPAVDKKLWVQMLQAAGMNQEAMNRWHREFELRAPNGHREFLVSLGLPPVEVERIRRLSRADQKPPTTGDDGPRNANLHKHFRKPGVHSNNRTAHKSL